MIGVPDFKRRRWKLKPVTFVPVSRAFKPQIKVRATRDLNGWADREQKVKWHIPTGSIGCIDAETAREFAAKGFVEILEGAVRPVSEAEAAEFLSQVTIIGPGVSSG
jgi:hypothetical protein